MFKNGQKWKDVSQSQHQLNKEEDMNILCFLLEIEMMGTEEKVLNKIRCSHRWVNDT